MQTGTRYFIDTGNKPIIMNHKSKAVITWILRIIPALIMLQTLFYKFTASEESVYIFTQLGMEPAGRIGIGVMELIASILIIIPKTTVYGAMLAIGLMCGALYFHLTMLGIVVMDDDGQLFIYALTVLICSVALFLMLRSQLYSAIKLNPNTVYEKVSNVRTCFDDLQVGIQPEHNIKK